MKVQKSQEANEENNNEEKVEGYMKSPRSVERELFGPESPLPDKWRVFNFIKYRIQDNKRQTETECMKREYIIDNTGICPNHFSRIIQRLERDKLIEVDRGDYRDSAAIYRLHKGRFKESVICPDGKKYGPVLAVDNSKGSVDKSSQEKKSDTKMVQEEDTQHQNGVDSHQNGVETPVTITELLGKNPLRSLSLDPLNLKPRSPGEEIGESFTLLGTESGPKKTIRAQTSEKVMLKQKEWLVATNGTISFEQWQVRA